MIIIGADFHSEFQQIAAVDTDTGELQERRLQNRDEVENFYRQLATRAIQVRVGMEASGHGRLRLQFSPVRFTIRVIRPNGPGCESGDFTPVIEAVIRRSQLRTVEPP